MTSYKLRQKLTDNFLGFCLVYLPHYFNRAPADFHPELIAELENHEELMLLVEGFRGSAKSTFATLAFALFAGLKHPDKYPFVIIGGDTQAQSSMNIANIKAEMDANKLLKQDFGEIRGDDPADWFLGSKDEWQAQNMVLGNGVRIMARSRGQKVRGLRHRQDRPKLVLLDDPEDLEWVRKKENRDATERWLRSEIIPATEKGARLILIGNHLHRDAIMARMSKTGLFKHLRYPLIDETGHCTWSAKYPTKADLDYEKKKVGPIAWMREYQLKVVPDDGQIITEEDIHYYDAIPEGKDVIQGLSGTAFDLAISKRETADYTAAVSGQILEYEQKRKIYIEKHPINQRLDFRETINLAESIVAARDGMHTLYVEKVAYQQAAIEEMIAQGLPVIPVKPIGDKTARLKIAVTHIKNGLILFPREGCEDLIHQLLGFGIEQHDDLVDSLVYLILELIKSKNQSFEFQLL
jgi:predicted phage terminase large subunit-like protein